MNSGQRIHALLVGQYKEFIQFARMELILIQLSVVILSIQGDTHF